MISFITDHINQAKKRLLEQYKKKTGINSILEALIQPLQEIETDGLATFYTHNAIDTAEGIQLDLIGEYVGLARVPGQSDVDYRVSIKGQISQNVSSGEIQRILDAYMNLVGATISYLIDTSTILVQGNVELTDSDTINKVFQELEKTAAAGIRIGYIVGYESLDDFSIDGTDIGQGFGDVSDSLIGGRLADLYTRTDYEFAFDGPDVFGAGFGDFRDPLVGGIFA